jgi:hypothetical protein
MRAADERDSARGRSGFEEIAIMSGGQGRAGQAYRRKGKYALTKLVMLTRIGARLAVLTIAVLLAVPG